MTQDFFSTDQIAMRAKDLPSPLVQNHLHRHDEIAQQIAEFLASGGVVEQLPHGASGCPDGTFYNGRMVLRTPCARDRLGQRITQSVTVHLDKKKHATSP